jgi:hypothetical protein
MLDTEVDVHFLAFNFDLRRMQVGRRFPARGRRPARQQIELA